MEDNIKLITDTKDAIQTSFAYSVITSNGSRKYNSNEQYTNIGNDQEQYSISEKEYENFCRRKFNAKKNRPIKLSGATYDSDDKPIPITGSYAVLSMIGVFKPLSMYYPIIFDIKKVEYRSVEHYAYQRLFEAIKVPDEAIEKLRNVEDPLELSALADIIYKEHKIPQEVVDGKIYKMDKWRQTAMKYKISRHEYLEQLLLATGDAILLEQQGNDKKWCCLISETIIQTELTREETTPAKLIDWMTQRKPVKPAHLNEMGGNRSGLVMMELREKFKNDNNDNRKIPIIVDFDKEKMKYYTSNHLVCFTAESVLHPFYPAPVSLKVNGIIEEYASAVHVYAKRAINQLGISLTTGDQIMSTESSIDCWIKLHQAIDKLELSLEKSMSWFMKEKYTFLAEAMTESFKQNPHLQRFLLETNEALLVFCSRFSTVDCEYSIGMRERDLRPWLAMQQLSTNDLIDICWNPLSFRPPYVGGNRIGFILMEIRHSLLLKGTYYKKLPEFQLSLDVLLGSDSPTENFVSNAPFNIISEENFGAIWPNPYLIEAKETKNYQMWKQGTMIKPMPIIISVDELLLTDVMNKLQAAQFDLYFSREILSKLTIEQMRSAAKKITQFFLASPGTNKKAEADMLRLLKEVGERDKYIRSVINQWTEQMSIDIYAGTFDDNNFNNTNRGVNNGRRMPMGNVNGPGVNMSMMNQNSGGVSGNYMNNLRMNSSQGMMNMNPLSNLGNFSTNNHFNSNSMHGNRSGNRRNNQGSRNNMGNNFQQGPNNTNRNRNNRSQMRNNQFSGNFNRSNNQNMRGPQQNSSPKITTTTTTTTIQHKKPKRVVNEDELSDGEIVSDED
uniref:NADAR domain-containing protein n=1 Tax=Strongyloides stercoralis TaxID=6248 RepID=A0A0K0EFT9_STRER